MRLLYTLIFFGLLNIMNAQEVRKAEVFLPGIVSLEDTWDEYLSFSPDGKILAFTRSGPDLNHYDRRIYISYLVDSKWTEPELAPFSEDFFDRGPSFSPDGNTLYFGSNRPGKRGFDYDSDIWFSRRNSSGSWGKAERLPDIINSDEFNEGHPSLAVNGNIYFVRYKRGVETDIYVSEWKDNKFHEPKRLNSNINTAGPDSHCYIDPYERFLIFTPTDRTGGYGAGDIYISYNDGGIWSDPENLGSSINSDLYEYSAKPGIDNKIYFSRAQFGQNARPSDIYSISLDLKIIDR